MSDKSAIEWTDATWNPIRARYVKIQDDGSGKTRIGWHCEHVSEGCRFCYAEDWNLRLGTGRAYAPDELNDPAHRHHRNGPVELFLDEKTLRQPLHWKRPRKIFLGSMTDIFARFVPDEWLDRIFAVMALAQQHTFQILTKRPERMLAYMTDQWSGFRFREAMQQLKPQAVIETVWPFPNVWFGVSVEDQPAADARIPLLLKTPAAKRFISAEPLLGPLDLRTIQIGNGVLLDSLTGLHGAKIDIEGGFENVQSNLHRFPILPIPTNRLDYVIAGGESGPHARFVLYSWLRLLRDQCAAAGVAFFFKQWGEWIDADQWLQHLRRDGAVAVSGIDLTGDLPALNFEDAARLARNAGFPFAHHSDGSTMLRVGKKRAGAFLDGRIHQAFPPEELAA